MKVVSWKMDIIFFNGLNGPPHILSLSITTLEDTDFSKDFDFVTLSWGLVMINMEG